MLLFAHSSFVAFTWLGGYIFKAVLPRFSLNSYLQRASITIRLDCLNHRRSSCVSESSLY